MVHYFADSWNPWMGVNGHKALERQTQPIPCEHIPHHDGRITTNLYDALLTTKGS